MLWVLQVLSQNQAIQIFHWSTVADPGFPVGGGRGPRRSGCGLPRRLRFKNFVCQNERIGTLRGGAPPPRSANGQDRQSQDVRTAEQSIGT